MAFLYPEIGPEHADFPFPPSMSIGQGSADKETSKASYMALIRTRSYAHIKLTRDTPFVLPYQSTFSPSAGKAGVSVVHIVAILSDLYIFSEVGLGILYLWVD